MGGRYELGELLGRGGMAEVRKGHDTRLGRVVAIKRLRTDLASDATFQARFRREAQSAASLNHPAIVAVYDTGEEPAADGSGVSQPYIVMEFVAGRTLRDILRDGRKILPERALEITSGVLSALDYSHRAGIIHRDIKPGNVMLTPSGDVKVMDFGIARAMSDSNTMTQTAAVVGTAQYLSPEQARGETVDSRSDVYSAGCLLYELLTGRPPFVGDSPVAVAYQHVREPARPPSDHDTDLTPAVDAIVMKALAKRLEDRYQSAAAMRSDIERYLAGRPVQAPVPVAAPPTPPEPPASDTSTSMRPPVPPAPVFDERDELDRGRGGPRASVLILLGLLVLALLAGGYVLLFKSDLFESAPEQVQVPNVIGMTEDEARDAIGDAGLTVDPPDFRTDDDPETKDKVLEQDPNRDQFVDPGTSVHLIDLLRRPPGRRAVRDRFDPGRGPQPAADRQARPAVREQGVGRAPGPGPLDRTGGRHRGRPGDRGHGDDQQGSDRRPQRGRAEPLRRDQADRGRRLPVRHPWRRQVDRGARHRHRPAATRRPAPAPGDDDHAVRVDLRAAAAPAADRHPDDPADAHGDPHRRHDAAGQCTD